MDGKKIYSITINGISESINAVDALNKQLLTLENRIKELEKSNVKINASGGGSKSSSSSLSEEAAIQKEINKLKQEGATLDAKIVAAQDEVYKKVDATKQLYKETVADQKALAAQERITADAYSNTMVGMKQHLADLKAVINATDLGDTDKINEMTKDANELTKKLKEMEEAYGQFGRNVGNYKSAADGFKGLRIEVAGVTHEFDNAKQALKTLQGDLRTLQVKKDQGMLLSEEEVKRFEELPSIVAQLKSSIQDAGKPMDGLMDTMQSIVAIAQTSKGISAFFGLEESGVEETIKNLVALQNAMQGLQTIQKQLQSQEGLGKWLAKGNAAIDTFTKKLFGLETTTKTTNAAIASTGTAGKTAAVGLGTASVAANTATKSFSLATAAATALRVALSAIGIGLIIAGISALVEGIGYLINKQKEAKKFQEDLNKTIEEGQKEYAKTTVELSQLKSKVDNFNGSKKQEKKLVDELNSKYGDALGQYKSLKEWKDALIKKGESYAKVLKLEAENQALLNMYTENFIKLMHAKDLAQKGPDFWDEAAEWLPWNWGGKSAQDKLNDTVKDIDTAGDEILKRIEANNKEIAQLNEENELFDYAPTIDKNADKTKKAIEEKYRTINQLELRLMQDGLNKKLRQLDEEERQTINKLKENSRLTADEMKRIQRAYSQLREKEIKEYLKNLEDSIKKSAQDIRNIQFEINTKEITNQIDALQNERQKLETLGGTMSLYGEPLTSRRDLKEIGIDVEDQLSRSFKSSLTIAREFYDILIKDLITYQKEEQSLIDENIKEEERKQKQAEVDRYNLQFDSLQKQLEEADRQIQLNKARNDEEVKLLEKLKDDRKIIEGQIEQALDQHMKKMQQITEASNNAIKKNELDTAADISSTQERYYNLQISNFREFLSKLNDEVNQNPVVDKDWGIVNISQTKKNYKEILNATKTALAAIRDEKKRIDKDLADGFISDEAAVATTKQLDDIARDIKQAEAVTKEASKNLVADFISSTQMYLQDALNSFNTIMSAVWNAQDAAFDKEQEQIDKTNDALDKALDKQQEIIEKHKSAIDSIEDELATARGDRRQHLIDQINAEIEAQRAAQKEEEKIKKQQEAQQRKQDELDLKRKKAEYKRNLLQAVVNGAMAVTMAAINKWPIPAIPMMALAASTTAAQIAIMAANKPYAKGGQLDGGVAQGKRHSEGGIPVLGGRASIEGGEFITNRQTTAKNVDLLEYINAKHRKLDIDDFIDFYSSGKVKKNITSMSPRAKFADGGVIPTLNNEYQFDDRLLSAFEDYANRPYVVSVVDINSRQAAVKNVQVLAGLGE